MHRWRTLALRSAVEANEVRTALRQVGHPANGNRSGRNVDADPRRIKRRIGSEDGAAVAMAYAVRNSREGGADPCPWQRLVSKSGSQDHSVRRVRGYSPSSASSRGLSTIVYMLFLPLARRHRSPRTETCHPAISVPTVSGRLPVGRRCDGCAWGTASRWTVCCPSSWLLTRAYPRLWHVKRLHCDGRWPACLPTAAPGTLLGGMSAPTCFPWS